MALATELLPRQKTFQNVPSGCLVIKCWLLPFLADVSLHVHPFLGQVPLMLETIRLFVASSQVKATCPV